VQVSNGYNPRGLGCIILHALFGIGSAYVAAKKKAPLSILHLNMESRSFPSNHDQPKDAWPNNPATYAATNEGVNLREKAITQIKCNGFNIIVGLIITPV
jgi:hypothetical protein